MKFKVKTYKPKLKQRFFVPKAIQTLVLTMTKQELKDFLVGKEVAIEFEDPVVFDRIAINVPRGTIKK